MDLRESRTRDGVRHPWESARADFLLRLLSRHGFASGRALDVGAGDAWFATQLLERGSGIDGVVCVDSAYDEARIRELSLPKTITPRTSLPSESFELLLALDVAEHVEDDVVFLRALRERAAPGATLLFTVPAWPALFSAHDRALLHHRRYTHAAARALLVGAGFRIAEDGGFFHALIAPRLFSLGLEKLGLGNENGNTSTAWRGSQTSARAIASVLRAENAVTHRLGNAGLSLPGLSYYAIAHSA